METLTKPTVALAPKTHSEPVLAAPAEAPADRDALAALRRFHLGGPVRPGASEPGLVPALLHAYRGMADMRTDYPVLVPAAPMAPPASLARLLQEAGPKAEENRVLAENLMRLERNARDIVTGRGCPADAREVLREAGEAMQREIKLTKADQETLRGGLGELLKKIPAGTLVPYTPIAPMELLRTASAAREASSRAAFQRRVQDTAAKLAAFLESDRRKRPGGTDPSALDGEMGAVGARFVDAGALAGMAGAAGRGEPLPEARRKNLESAHKTLRVAEELLGRATLVHEREFGGLIAGLEGWKAEEHEDPCEAAARRFDEAAENLARVLRAERLARMELDGIYDPDRHDPWLARLDWTMFSREETAALPAVAALVSGDQLARRGLPSLSRLLLSGRPVQVLVLENPARNPGSEAGSLSGFRFEPGYLGLSHREAFVQQTSSARPLHMMAGFRRALAGTRTALHVVATGSEDPAGLGSWLTAGAALESRSHPFFHYDPEAGNSWARRLDFGENPQPEADWPAYELAVKTEAGAKQALSLAFTFADFALLDPALTKHFTPVPATVAETDLVTVDHYLRLPEDQAAVKVPFVWAVDAEGRLRRLAVTREVAMATRDRLNTWRILQELAGIRNEYAEAAAQKAREEAEAKAAAERETLTAAHAEELERVRSTAAEETLTRLTAALMDVDFASLAATASPLDALRGRSVDEVAGALLAAADPSRLEENSR